MKKLKLGQDVTLDMSLGARVRRLLLIGFSGNFDYELTMDIEDRICGSIAPSLRGTLDSLEEAL